jgi:hypothetical protein
MPRGGNEEPKIPQGIMRNEEFLKKIHRGIYEEFLENSSRNLSVIP